MIRKMKIKSLPFLNAFLAFMIVIVCAADAFAQPASSCDPQLMEAMEARSWMETNRENVQMRNLMPRPDSVLEYSCFDQLVSLVGELPAEIFSDDENKWLLSTGGLPHIDNVSTDIALQEVVGIALFTYLFTNFGHTYIGDRTEILGAAPPRAPGDYVCGALNYVWEQAKCMDFGEFRGEMEPGRTDWELFYDFYWYSGNDPRNLPLDPPACEPLSDVWDSAAVTAFNDEADDLDRRSDRYILDAGLEAMFDNTTPYDVTLARPADSAIADMYSRMMVEGSHALFEECITIQTGIQVVRTAGESGPTADYPDASCPNPQCFYNKSECTQ